MAIKLENKTNVLAPNATYPYGNIKDNSGANDGTPVNTQVYGDIHQFFARLLALSGIVANGLPDNATNGFQYYEALQANIQSYVDALVDAAPGALDTLNELAAALGDDPNFATTVTNSLATKFNKQQPNWQNITTLNSGYTASAQGPQYRVDETGMVYLRGSIVVSSASGPSPFTLPAEPRPYYDSAFIIPHNIGSPNFTSIYMTIESSGGANFQGGTPANGTFFLDGVRFFSKVN